MKACRPLFMTWSRCALLFVLLSGTVATAQPYTVTSSSATYVPVASSGSRAQLQGTDPTDNGRATVPIGFSFPFFGKSYSQLVVTANGLAFLEQTTCSNCDYPSNAPLPSSLLPNGLLAPFWDDLKLSYSTSGIFYEHRQVNGVDSLVVEWRDLNHWFQTSQYKFSVELIVSATGEITFHYGPATGAGAPISATMGIESPDGSYGLEAKGCAPNCTLSDLVPNERITFSAPSAVELSVPGVTLQSVTLNGTDLSLDTTTTIRNFSQTAATGVQYALFLSKDQLYQPASDIPLSPSSAGPVNIAALGTANHSTTSTVARPADGKWYVVALADPFSAFTEPDETNNSGGTAVPFAVGADLIADSLTGPTLTGANEQVSFTATVHNSGIDAPLNGTVGYNIRLSSDPVLDASDFIAASGTFVLGARETATKQLTATLPSNTPSGQFYWLLELDPSAAIAEVDEGNNIAIAPAQVTASATDLEVTSIELRDAAAPNDPISRLFFSAQARFDVTVHNLGGASANGASLGLFISDNSTFNALSDTRFSLQTISIAPGQTKTFQVTATVPAVDRNGNPFIDGNDFIIARAVASGDPNSLNDIAEVGPIPIVNAAPDLTVRALVGPSTVGVGETFTVTRRIRNGGNRDAGTAEYRYLLSGNDIATTADALLPIVDGGQQFDGGFVTLAAGEDSVQSEQVRVPMNLAPGDYQLAAIVDPFNQVHEYDEANNAYVAGGITVVGTSLGLDEPMLPDAQLNRPYVATITTHGGNGVVSFASSSLPPGLALTPFGTLSGTPTQTGVFAIPITLSSNGRIQQVAAAIRVQPQTSSLAISVQPIPPIQRGVDYDFPLAAQGGVLPYRWSFVSGSLPPGIQLGSDGHLRGTSSSSDGAITARVQVSDAVGTIDQSDVVLRVVSSGALILQAVTPPPAIVGTEYATDFYAQNANGAPLTGVLEWSIVEGELPPGLGLDPRDQLLLVRGTPTRQGSYPMAIEVTDRDGRIDTVSVLFQIFAPSDLLTADLPDVLHPGDTVSGQIHADGLSELRLVGGELPPGAVLGSHGELSGTVDADAAARTYAFTVSGELPSGGQRLGAFALPVQVPEALSAPRSCGCSLVQLPELSALLLIVAFWKRRRTR